MHILLHFFHNLLRWFKCYDSFSSLYQVSFNAWIGFIAWRFPRQFQVVNVLWVALSLGQWDLKKRNRGDCCIISSWFFSYLCVCSFCLNSKSTWPWLAFLSLNKSNHCFSTIRLKLVVWITSQLTIEWLENRVMNWMVKCGRKSQVLTWNINVHCLIVNHAPRGITVGICHFGC